MPWEPEPLARLCADAPIGVAEVVARCLEKDRSERFASAKELLAALGKVGLLRAREDGDYELHAYAPRNQTRAMMEEERTATRQRVREW